MYFIQNPFNESAFVNLKYVRSVNYMRADRNGQSFNFIRFTYKNNEIEDWNVPNRDSGFKMVKDLSEKIIFVNLEGDD